MQWEFRLDYQEAIRVGQNKSERVGLIFQHLAFRVKKQTKRRGPIYVIKRAAAPFGP